MQSASVKATFLDGGAWERARVQPTLEMRDLCKILKTIGYIFEKLKRPDSGLGGVSGSSPNVDGPHRHNQFAQITVEILQMY